VVTDDVVFCLLLAGLFMIMDGRSSRTPRSYGERIAGEVLVIAASVTETAVSLLHGATAQAIFSSFITGVLVTTLAVLIWRARGRS
jgi:hypothetical protein